MHYILLWYNIGLKVITRAKLRFSVMPWWLVQISKIIILGCIIRRILYLCRRGGIKKQIHFKVDKWKMLFTRVIASCQHFKPQLKYKSIRLNKADTFVSCYSIVGYNKDEKSDHIDLLHMDKFHYPDTRNIRFYGKTFTS